MKNALLAALNAIVSDLLVATAAIQTDDYATALEHLRAADDRIRAASEELA